MSNSSMIPVSVIIVTKNAAATLPDCLQALTGFSERLVVDSASADRTCQIATDHGAQLVSYFWNGKYPKKRQWCLETLALKHDWVLFIDADEIMTPKLEKEITALFTPNSPSAADPLIAGYFIPGRYVWNGQYLKYGLCNRKIALLHRRRMIFPEIDDLDCPGMGEIEGHYQPVPKSPDGKISALSASLHHHANHSPAAWLERHRRYAAWECCINRKNIWPDDPLPWRRRIKKFLRQSPLRPELVFIHSYFLKGGFLDGVAGFEFARSRWQYYQMIRFPEKV
ncbi:MAG: glycosyltransferase family 2 protein [Rhodospirillales bacterium]|nr:glycosyltransferase family 2 protein [Rhodospirillales bacterium]MCB9964574.1 glycosyltransferase family 2 protein [Rhodospirillales bacterium]MCB9973903.1 glycosyltransferase family 2 protein [Rhodospirillales bacterium]MCB9980528.1 glycosyltransferase family 2 protein [Rhodospirillales bacterium]